MSATYLLLEASSLLTQGEIKITPKPPPEAGKLLNIINYIAWIAMLAGVASLIYAGGKFGWERWHGGALESPKIVLGALVGGILSTTAGGIMNAIVTGG
ncbi:hypothetical protein [Nocardia sp. XZ_19_385]|uniref:hypothetical protein n=1 Tax=Nocardia sp. XZ_19_385 TaxID=2769488 RepID=UPI00188F41B3|nr:hypothetical protein [Nocardia sp. XZ_19_385]